VTKYGLAFDHQAVVGLVRDRGTAQTLPKKARAISDGPSSHHAAGASAVAPLVIYAICNQGVAFSPSKKGPGILVDLAH
jgi:hypothetical protein|tara:strand:- start:95 stop:331 length:237 start_codon:yes stop_codon:yes gene_type:complete